jgi:hypothetical protein
MESLVWQLISYNGMQSSSWSPFWRPLNHVNSTGAELLLIPFEKAGPALVLKCYERIPRH